MDELQRRKALEQAVEFLTHSSNTVDATVSNAVSVATLWHALVLLASSWQMGDLIPPAVMLPEFEDEVKPSHVRAMEGLSHVLVYGGIPAEQALAELRERITQHQATA